MRHKLETYNYAGNKLILYFSTEKYLKEAQLTMGKKGNNVLSVVNLADYVIEVNDDYTPARESLLKCRYAGGLEAVMDEFMDKKDENNVQYNYGRLE